MGNKKLVIDKKRGKQYKNTPKTLKKMRGGSKLNFEYFVKDINNDLEKYKILYIKRQGKLLSLCNNVIKEINNKQNSINNRFKIESYSNKYNISRYLTLINREFYQNIFKKYFINIIQLFNETNFTNVQENLKGIARELQFINKDEANEEKEMLINNDFKMFEKYTVDDIVRPEELKESIGNRFSEMKNILNIKINDNKDDGGEESFDTVSIQNNLNTTIKNYIDNWEIPTWQPVLLNTFEYEIANIKSIYEDPSSIIKHKINNKFYLEYVTEIYEYLSIEYSSASDVKKGNKKTSEELKLKVEKLIEDINVSIESIRNKDKKDKINRERDDVLTRVILIIKKHLLKLVRKNYLNSLDNISILKNYVEKQLSELEKSITDYSNKLNSNKPEKKEKKEEGDNDSKEKPAQAPVQAQAPASKPPAQVQPPTSTPPASKPPSQPPAQASNKPIVPEQPQVSPQPPNKPIVPEQPQVSPQPPNKPIVQEQPQEPSRPPTPVQPPTPIQPPTPFQFPAQPPAQSPPPPQLLPQNKPEDPFSVQSTPPPLINKPQSTDIIFDAEDFRKWSIENYGNNQKPPVVQDIQYIQPRPPTTLSYMQPYQQPYQLQQPYPLQTYPQTYPNDRYLYLGGDKKNSYKVCSYITDVEGNMSYFEKYVKISKVIGWANDKKDRLQFKTKDSIFVYGGDTQDKGDNDIMFVNLLLKFKEDYPDRVFFIIGNRDANKLRFPSELLENYSNEKAFIKKYDNFPYWVKKDARVTLKNYLKITNSTLNIKNRLSYILKHTMGCKDDCFERRRKELSVILKRNINNIRDEDVVASFLNSVMPIPENVKNSNDNYMLKYLRHGKIAHIFGKHIFVHGSINENNIGHVPKSKKNIEDINEWVNKLNEWFHKELNEYIKNPKSGGISKKRKAYSIIDYSVPQVTQATQATSKKIIKPSVVYSDNLKDGNGAMIKSKVIKQLNKSGIYTVITGHKPHGDCPLVIRNKNLIAISADISYSNVNNLKEKKIISHDTRGSAVCEVLLYFNGDIRVHGILANKNKYNYLIKLEDQKDRKDYKQYIGLQLKNRYWVKNVIKDKFLISFGKGFDIFEKWVSIKELKELLK